MKIVRVLCAAIAILVAVPAPAQAANLPVEVIDDAHALSETDREDLVTETNKIPLPDSVGTVLYAVYEHNAADVLDTLLEDLAAHHSEYMTAEKDGFAPHLLAVAVGRDPRSITLGCGREVCTDLNFSDEARSSGILDQMRPLLVEGKISAGMLAGVKAAANPNFTRQAPADAAHWGLFVAATALITVGGFAVLWMERRRRVRRLRAKFTYLRHSAGAGEEALARGEEIISGLDGPLATEPLRAQWGQLRKNYLLERENIASFGKAKRTLSPAELLRAEPSISTCYAALQPLCLAADQLESLQRMAAGDTSVRRYEGEWLLGDVQEARSRAEAAGLSASTRIARLEDQVKDLIAHTERADFMTDFARILKDYHPIVGALPERIYSRSGLGHRAVPPVLGSRHWHPGMGTHYMPLAFAEFWVGNSSVSADLPPAYRS